MRKCKFGWLARPVGRRVCRKKAKVKKAKNSFATYALLSGEYESDECLLCGKPFIAGETGNELGFCEKCQRKSSFPYDLDRYYRDLDG